MPRRLGSASKVRVNLHVGRPWTFDLPRLEHPCIVRDTSKVAENGPDHAVTHGEWRLADLGKVPEAFDVEAVT